MTKLAAFLRAIRAGYEPSPVNPVPTRNTVVFDPPRSVASDLEKIALDVIRYRASIEANSSTASDDRRWLLRYIARHIPSEKDA